MFCSFSSWLRGLTARLPCVEGVQRSSERAAFARGRNGSLATGSSILARLHQKDEMGLQVLQNTREWNKRVVDKGVAFEEGESSKYLPDGV